MSLILDALSRAERERRAGERPVPDLLTPAGSGPLGRHPALLPVVLVALLLLVLVPLAWWLTGSQEPARSDVAAPAPAVQAVAAPSVRRDVRAAGDTGQRRASSTAAADAPADPREAQRIAALYAAAPSPTVSRDGDAAGTAGSGPGTRERVAAEGASVNRGRRPLADTSAVVESPPPRPQAASPDTNNGTAGDRNNGKAGDTSSGTAGEPRIVARENTAVAASGLAGATAPARERRQTAATPVSAEADTPRIDRARGVTAESDNAGADDAAGGGAAEQEVEVDLRELLRRVQDEAQDEALEPHPAPLFSDLSQRFRDQVPTLMYLRHDYRNNGASTVTINGEQLREGQRSRGVQVVEILRDSVILRFDAQDFRLRALNSWVNL